MNRIPTFLVTLGIVGLLAVPVAAKKAPAKPTHAAIKRLLAYHYTGESRMYASVRESWTAKTIVYGKPRLGSYYHDGVPPHTKTTVFPVKVRAIYYICYSTDHTVDRQHINATYVFFRDEFRKWTFRIQDESRTDPSGSHLPKGTKCPVKSKK
jgi:hypothetical protein